MNCFFVSDLHGLKPRYQMLFRKIREEKPGLVLFGGDLLPLRDPGGFLSEFLFSEIRLLKDELKQDFPFLAVIPGNDDPAVFDSMFLDAESEGLLAFIPEKTINYNGYTITGYPFAPPTPFQLKDREKYDVSRYVDPGCLPPDSGRRTVEPKYDLEFSNIATDLKKLSETLDPRSSIFLFHSPPYQSGLDRAALDGQKYDHVPLDVHIGSIAIQRFIESFQPFLTLHGHVHESSRITRTWKTRSGNTTCLSAAAETPVLGLVRFDLKNPENANREDI